MTNEQHQTRIYLSPPHMCGRELEYVKDAFASNWIAPLGPYVNSLEKSLCTFINIKSCAALSSGTAALHLALQLLDIKEGDHVICPSFTFSASANPIMYQHAIPVFIDSEPETWNMDPQLLEEAIKFYIAKNKKPKAIIIVHLYGMPAAMNELMSIADKYEIPVIEDAAESLGSTYQNQQTGSFGKLSILSFNGNKIITTSGGGALLSHDTDLIEKAKFLATQAREIAPHYEHTTVGYNYRLSNICAAIGCGQMEVLAERILQRRNNFQYYTDHLSTIEGITFLPEPKHCSSNRWLTTCLIDTKKTGKTRDEISQPLQQENIESRPLWKPLHLQPVFKQFPSFLNGNCANWFDAGICLPSGSSLTTQQLERICSIIHSTIQH